MSETPITPPARHSLFERMRGPMTLLTIALGGLALYYSLFFERKTSYFRDRNARLTARLADQVRRSIDSTARLVSNAAAIPETDLKGVYQFDRGLSDEQRQPQAVFDDLKLVPDEQKTHRALREAKYENNLLKLVFEGDTAVVAPDEPVRLESPAVADREPVGQKRYASATIPLQRLLNTVVGQTAGEVFDTVFILDAGGNVIYQSTRHTDDESEPDVRIVRVKELRVPRMFEGEATLQVADLMSASRQMGVRIGDASYQLFSVPIRSTIKMPDDAQPQVAAKDDPAAGVPRDLWVICGAVSTSEFRSRSLAISVTILSCLAGAFLLTIFSWPFAKMAMTSAQHKVTLVDVILLGVSGILAVSIVCLIVLDGFTFRKLEANADDQLKALAGGITANFREQISTAVRQLDVLQQYAEAQIAAGTAKSRNGNLLAGFTKIDKPYFQSFFLISRKGRQAVKWSVDGLATPLTNVAMRRYFSAPDKERSEYLYFGKRRITVDSIRSATSPQPEVVFARRTRDTGLASDRRFQAQFPVIAMSMPAALPIINPVMPLDFGYAIVEANGTVLFHSDSNRNTVENFFAETDDDPRVKAAVEARQNECMSIRYWGEDYRAYVQPMKGLPWTLITFRAERGLRTLNAEALTITLIFLLALFGGGLLALISLMLLFKPRYRARWAWPDPARVRTYAELSAIYLVLLAAAAVLFLTLEDAALLAFPFWFVPLVCLITYLYLRTCVRGLKRMIVATISVALTLALLVLLWRGRTGGWADAAMVGAAVLLVAALTRALLRPDDADDRDRLRDRQTALPLCYVGAAFLLLLVTSVVPTAAFFKASYDMETESYVKWVQMKLARDLQSRWWRVSWDFNEERGKGKKRYAATRWNDLHDVYSSTLYGTAVTLRTDANAVAPREREMQTAAIPEALEALLPRYSDASVKTRELVHDRAADDLWWWTRRGPDIELYMQNLQPLAPFSISSSVPALLPSLRHNGSHGAAPHGAAVALAWLVIAFVAFCIARFIARRVFLVDMVNPLWLAQGFLGLRHVLCHPCDDAAARRLFHDFKRIDLSVEADRELARTAPQSFTEFEPSVFIDGLDYEFAAGEGSKLVRGLIERLTRNGDRTIALRPTAMNVITAAVLQGDDREGWAKMLSSFVWVNGSQLVTADKRLTFSGPRPVIEDESTTGLNRWRWRSLRGLYVLSGFHAYLEQFTDTRRSIERTLVRETEADPYLEALMAGLGAHASGREQLLDEISERAEEYYNALWRTCTANEQLVLMQIAQTGLVNGKTRKDVRRLLARGLLLRDPQLRPMNETFRRFVVAQCATSSLAHQLEQNLAGDAWNRFRVPFFAAIALVMLFFFTTQRQTFDATIALVGGLAASLPTFLRTLSGLGERAGAR
jgi:hypothetical protein